jgi:1-deoxy-D-xylulose-5-phosphate synthase
LDVGIAEQHAVTAAAGMAMAGLRPVVAVYSTFFSRAFDQANLDVGLHKLPVVFFLDRAGITGDDGPSHHGVLDLSLTLSIPNMTVFAPSSAQEVPVMLEQAMTIDGPVAIRVPKTMARQAKPGAVGQGMAGRMVRHGDGSVCLLAIGKMVEVAESASELLSQQGVDATVWDVRVIAPPDPYMLADAAAHSLVVTIEDGIRVGGAGTVLVDTMRTLPELDRPLPPVRMLGLPLEYIPQGKPDAILARLGLDAAGVTRSVMAALATEQERLHLA